MYEKINIFPDVSSLALAVAERFINLAVKAITTRGRFSVALSGGSTPKKIFRTLATKKFASRVGWQFVHTFWCDERCVPPDHRDSNFRMAREMFIDRIPLPKDNIHRIRGEIGPVKAAGDYQRRLLSFFYPQLGRKGTSVSGLIPRFDLILLGVGEDGHTASLFPGSSILSERKRWVMPVHAPPHITPQQRITFTLPVLNNASNVFFIVSGIHKREIVRSILDDPKTATRHYPAAMVQPKRGAVWWMDEDAAGSIGNEDV